MRKFDSVFKIRWKTKIKSQTVQKPSRKENKEVKTSLRLNCKKAIIF